MSPQPHVFISYAVEDREVVSRLAEELEALEFSLWLDQTKLSPGVRWKDEIRRAIGTGAAFLACFSSASAARDRSYMREEIALACDELRMRPRERAWFVPILLDGGEIPDIPLGAFETLRDLQYVDLRDNWELGIRRLVGAMRPLEGVVDRLLERAGDQDLSESSRLMLLDRAVSLSPRRRELRRARAKLHIANGDAEQAVGDYEEAAPAYPAERAWCYWLAGDEDSAIATYKRLAKRTAATARDHYDLGCLLYNAGRPNEAHDAFCAAAGSDPSALAPKLMQLRLWLQHGHPVRLVRLAREIEVAFGEHPDVYEARAQAMIFAHRAGQLDTEEEDHLKPYDHHYVMEQFSRACNLDKENARRFYRVAKVLFDVGDYRNSGVVATAGLKILPGSRSLLVVLAQVVEYGPAEVVKDGDAACLYEEAVEADPDDLDREDDIPIFGGDERTPRPKMHRYATVPLTLAGTAVLGHSQFR